MLLQAVVVEVVAAIVVPVL